MGKSKTFHISNEADLKICNNKLNAQTKELNLKKQNNANKNILLFQPDKKFWQEIQTGEQD